MPEESLGDLSVEFSTKGLSEAQAGLANIGSLFTGVSRAAQNLAQAAQQVTTALSPNAMGGALQNLGQLLDMANKRTNDWAGRLKNSFKELGEAGGGVFGLLSVSVGGFVLAGFHASQAGALFSLRMQELSRQIASLFLPQIERALNWMERLVVWFRNLSGEQQNAIGKWLTGAAVLTGMTAILPRLIAGFEALNKLGLAFGGTLSTLFAGHPLLVLAAALAGVTLKTEEWKTVLRGVKELVLDTAAALKEVGSAILEAVGWARGLVQEMREVVGLSSINQRQSGQSDWQWMKDNLDLWQNQKDLMTRLGAGTGTFNKLVSAVTLPATAGPATLLKIAGLTETHRPPPLTFEPEKKKEHEELAPRLGGMRSLTAAYNAISEKTVMATSGVKDPQQQAVDILKDLQEIGKKMLDTLSILRPAVI